MKVCQYAGDCEGMVDIVFAAFAALTFMRLRADLICLLYDIYLGIVKIRFQCRAKSPELLLFFIRDLKPTKEIR